MSGFTLLTGLTSGAEGTGVTTLGGTGGPPGGTTLGGTGGPPGGPPGGPTLYGLARGTN